MKYVHQASVCKPHTITRSQAGSLHYIDKPSILPEQFHRRKSEKRVRDEVYCTMAELSGHGFSYREIQIAIQVVGNTLFGTKWKLPWELDKDHYDIDSMSQNLMQIHFWLVKTCGKCWTVQNSLHRISKYFLAKEIREKILHLQTFNGCWFNKNRDFQFK